MGKVKQVTVRHSVEIALMYQKRGIRGKKLYEKYPQYSRATIYQHALKPISLDIDSIDKRKQNKGRPTKLLEKDTRRILRALHKLLKKMRVRLQHQELHEKLGLVVKSQIALTQSKIV